MKVFYISLLLAFAVSAAAQRPWTPIHSDKMYTFQKCEINDPQNWGYSQSFYYYLSTDPYFDRIFCIQNIQVMSDTIVGSDTILVLNTKAKPRGFSSQNPTLWNFYDEGILGTQIRISGQDYYFEGRDSFLLRPEANLNETWLFRDTILATVSDIRADTMFGIPDSLKVITLSNGDSMG